MLFLILYMFMFIAPVTSDPLVKFCSENTSTYILNSPFHYNLKDLLNALPSNASLPGFYNTYTGDDPNRVYGQALCRGDVAPKVCQNCLENAAKEIMNECQQRNDAILWYELCQLRYSIQRFFNQSVYTGKYPESISDKKILKDSGNFDNVLMGLMKNLSNEAAFDTSKCMFATKDAKFSRVDTIYALVQCTRDISGNDCRDCLESALADLGACCKSRQGGMVLSRNCNMRFEVYRFYNASRCASTESCAKDGWKIWVFTCIPTFIVALLIGFAFHLRRKKRTQTDEEKSQHALLQDLASPIGVSVTQEGNLVRSEELPFMDLAIIRASTDNFLDSNMLGRGGFGTVYKGVLPNGKEIAIKRLSKKSWQGLDEFKNEIILISKLQHRNLMSLLGCSIEGEEKLLIYEYMPNRSLDIFLFDSVKRVQLNWKIRHNIIGGIAKGLLYLHEDSRLKIIHRDLKPSNILLDLEMIPKISDFGMARIFCENQNTANTRSVVGTHGYMAPEYAMEGLFSVKSDVFSFGVILLEIISGKRSSGFYFTEHAQTLLAYAWRLWNEGKELEFVDPLLTESCLMAQVLRCIHIGLLCVQEDPSDRPNMSSVVALLGTESLDLLEPRKPAFSVGRGIQIDQSSNSNPSVNMVTVSSITPR